MTQMFGSSAAVLVAVGLAYATQYLPRPGWLTPRRVVLLFGATLVAAVALVWVSVLLG